MRAMRVTGGMGRRAGAPRVQTAAGRRSLMSWLAIGQGVYYAATGVWPLLNIRTFQFVTGPKVDLWLVKTVGVLVSVIGIALTVAGLRRRVSGEMVLLASGAAAGLTAIDGVYAARGRISKVYLLDALAEIALVAAWALAWRRAGGRAKP